MIVIVGFSARGKSVKFGGSSVAVDNGVVHSQ
jgi:hypothetical protein